MARARGTNNGAKLFVCVVRQLQDLATSSTTDITHLLIDEVHERDINTDFLLCLIRRILVKNRKLKVRQTVSASEWILYVYLSCSALTVG